MKTIIIKVFLVILVIIVSAGVIITISCWNSIKPDKATLFEAIDDWVRLLEADKLSEASQRWCQNEEARQQMAQRWQDLKRCHQQFDYRNWSRQAKELDGSVLI